MNMTQCISSLIIQMTLIFSQLLRRKKDIQNHLFLLIMILNTGALCGELCMLYYMHTENASRFLFHLGSVMEMLFGTIQFPILFMYLLNDGSVMHKKGVRRIIGTANAIALLCIILHPLVPYVITRILHADSLMFAARYSAVNGMAILIEHFVLLTGVILLKDISGQKRKMILLYCTVMILAALIDLHYNILLFSYSLTVFVLLFIYLNFQLDAEKRMESMEMEILDSRIRLTLSRFRPDFVFEILDEIENLCMIDNDRAQHTIAVLSDYLRGNIDRIDTNDQILFEDEIEHIQKYIELVQSSDPNVRISFDLAVKGFMIPIRTVYPVVEQLVIGGRVEGRASTDIHIESRLEDDCNVVEVIGPGRQTHHEMDVATEQYHNIMSGMKQVYGSSVTLYSTLDRNLHAVIRYPVHGRGNAV